MLRLRLNPITRKRLRRFREMRRAYASFWILVSLYAVSLCAALICNSVPLYVRYEGRSYFPVFRFYPEDTFTGSGNLARADYRAIEGSEGFAAGESNLMIWPLVPYGPYAVTDLSTLEERRRVTVRIVPEPRVGSIRVDAALTIVQALEAAAFFAVDDDAQLEGKLLTEQWNLSPEMIRAIAARFRNEPSEPIAVGASRSDGAESAELSLPTYRVRRAPPKLLKIMLRDRSQQGKRHEFVFNLEGDMIRGDARQWERLPTQIAASLANGITDPDGGNVEGLQVAMDGIDYRVTVEHERVRFPFRPCCGHWMGIDNAGRDVLARILYGLRTSMTFGLVLVACSLFFGTLVGAVQGYFGGVWDIAGQRLIEIWSALPFLYIMILMGSIYGPSFTLLIICYGLFNWIGMSYYMRAEMLRLRKQPFVEAARCLGLPARSIMFRHILPNALVPLITLFPFSLVGAIGSLAALDYLGFGLPPPTPSWGELLAQAQSLRWAWWLILYPSLALFLVMLLGVFVGEGIRNAFDPRRYSKLQ